MFLNEDKIINTYDAAKAEASFLYEAVLEANETYHDICMKMVKCEHYCIVNENATMLAEAEEEAKKSFKESVMTLLKKVKEAIINFGKWLVEKLRQAFAWIAKIPGNIKGAIKGSLSKLKKAEADVDAINAANDPTEIKFNDSVSEEAEEETVDAKTGMGIAKNIIQKIKAATAKLNVFRRSAENAASDADENPQESHKRLAGISSAISKAFSRIRSAFSTAFRFIVNGLKTAGQAVANTAKKAADAVKSKVQKKEPEIKMLNSESVEAEIFLEDVMYNIEDSMLNEGTSILTPIYLAVESLTGKSNKRLEELEDSFKNMKKESQRTRLLGRIKRSISTAELALDKSFYGTIHKLVSGGKVPTGKSIPLVGGLVSIPVNIPLGPIRVILQNPEKSRAKTKEYLNKLRDLEKKVEAKKFSE